MTIGAMRDLIISLKNEGQGAYHAPDEIVRALNNGSTDKFNEEKRAFEATSYISDNLSEFKVGPTEVPITLGLGNKPADYALRTGAETSDGVEIEIVPEGEWVARKNDPVAVPSTTKPICAIRDQIQVYPSTVTAIYLYYLRKPVQMVFGYTTDGNGVVTQDLGSSVDCDWPDDCHNDIVLRALPYLGVPLSDELLIRFKSIKLQTEHV